MNTLLIQQELGCSTRDLDGIAIAPTLHQVPVLPKFNRSETVSFLGGIGTIKSFQPTFGTWMYRVEMELGPEPEMGRIGSETTVLLYESDIDEVAIAKEQGLN
ncbi:hypothetical protein [Leptolyngbya sp. FACHB-541]|uniref:hypothetical protein n=1 Tax=Leptolyngbya sp. FACHB-541 TaxID=2692810 RepID=UPI001F54D706|nr:hypothetical protein [Leptolyngbya sp. FACHB-541]